MESGSQNLETVPCQNIAYSHIFAMPPKGRGGAGQGDSGSSGRRPAAGPGGARGGQGRAQADGAGGGRGGSGGRQGTVISMVNSINRRRQAASRSPSKRQRQPSEDSSTDGRQQVGRSDDETDDQLSAGTFQAQISSLSAMLVKKIDDSTDRLSNEFAKMMERVVGLEKHVEEQGVLIDSMRDAISERDARISDLEEAIVVMKREQNLPYLMFDGGAVPPPPANEPWKEDVRSTVLDLVKENMPDVSVAKSDIAESYRVAKGKRIVCKFVRYGRDSPRDQIYQRRMSLGKDRNGERKSIQQQLFINEVLTEGAQYAYSELRKARKAGLIHTVFTRQCKIYVRMIEHGEIRQVKGQRDLDQILGEGESRRNG